MWFHCLHEPLTSSPHSTRSDQRVRRLSATIRRLLRYQSFRGTRCATASTKHHGRYAVNAGWVACNAPPRYWLSVTVRDCAILYHRYAARPRFEERHPWLAHRTPWILNAEGNVCVMRLENYHRRKSDTFSIFDIFSAAFRALGQCNQGYGGAASIGSEYFFVSVAGAIPAPQSAAPVYNVTLSLPTVLAAEQTRSLRTYLRYGNLL